MDPIRDLLVSLDVQERHRIAARHRLLQAASLPQRPRRGFVARIGRLLVAAGGRLEATARTREQLSRSWAEEPTSR